ncbi:unnamed protein product, partial [Timema podura]|nr:unnamed protein product [Timema podura]
PLSTAEKEALKIFSSDSKNNVEVNTYRMTLKTKYKEAKEAAEKIEVIREKIVNLRSILENPTSKSPRSSLTDPTFTQEEFLQHIRTKLEKEQLCYKTQLVTLQNLKTETDHIKHGLEQANIRYFNRFQDWWKTQEGLTVTTGNGSSSILPNVEKIIHNGDKINNRDKFLETFGSNSKTVSGNVNYIAPLPDIVGINGKDVQTYSIPKTDSIIKREHKYANAFIKPQNLQNDDKKQINLKLKDGEVCLQNQNQGKEKSLYSNERDDPTIKSLSIYSAWQRWNTVSSLVISKNEVNILPEFGNVTTLKTSGSTIITGHESGKIAMWDFDANLRSSLQWGPQQGQVNVMEVMCLSVVSPRSKLKHDYLLFSSNNLLQIAYLKEYAIVSLGTICIHATQIKTLSVYNKYVAVLSEDQFSLWCMHRNYSPEDIKAEQGGIVRNQQSTILATVSLWGGVVSALSATMNFCMLSSATKKFQSEVLPEGDAFESASIVRAYLWQNSVSVSLTGQLHLFSLQQIEDLLCLNINEPSLSLKVSGNAIAEINVTETLLGPIITVCSSKKVYCIKLSKEL